MSSPTSSRWCCRCCTAYWPKTRPRAPQLRGSARAREAALQAFDAEEETAHAIRPIGFIGMQTSDQTVSGLDDEHLRKGKLPARLEPVVGGDLEGGGLTVLRQEGLRDR